MVWGWPLVGLFRGGGRSLSLGRGYAPMAVALVLGLLASGFLSLSLGSVAIPLHDIVAILGGKAIAHAPWATIIFEFRLPKVITAALAGSALGVSGLLMQTLFQNPLAGPFVLGINSGASLGVALLVLATHTLVLPTFFSNLSLVMAAIAGASGVMLLVLLLARRVQNLTTILILGLMFGYGVNSLVSILLHFSASEQMKAYLNWTFGSFSNVTRSQLPWLAISVGVGLLLAYQMAKPLNILLLGERYGASLGLNVARSRIWIMGSAAILAGVVTAFCGPISFLGVAVPHLARRLLKTADHRLLLPTVTFLGAILAIWADLLAQLPHSQLILPLNAVTSLLGAPLVTWVILKNQRLGQP